MVEAKKSRSPFDSQQSYTLHSPHGQKMTFVQSMGKSNISLQNVSNNGRKTENTYQKPLTNHLRLIKESSDDVNPERLGDVAALGIVLLHPFQDGNGRTARIVGSIFHEEYDDGWENNYGIVSESRDVARARGGFMINGYIPYLPEGKSQSNPEDVIAYLESLLSSEHEDSRLYTGPFGQASLYK